MIVVTGAGGFIGSCLVRYLNDLGIDELILVDAFSFSDKHRYLKGKKWRLMIDRNQFIDWFEKNASQVQFVFHLGARTDTVEKSWEVFRKLNLWYSIKLWQICALNNIPFLYASSAATYGDGSSGYSDEHSLLHSLIPLNPYARSKHLMDLWAVHQHIKPPHWWGLKFFNVYGPNEYHKGRMASVVFHGFKQVIQAGVIKLFMSHKRGIDHGEQKRDFIYVRDVVKVLVHFFKVKPPSGIYNVGTGIARSFNDLAKAIFNALNMPPRIQYIPMPEQLRDQYQYYTRAEIGKLRDQAGYKEKFISLEEGVKEYVGDYLAEGFRIW